MSKINIPSLKLDAKENKEVITREYVKHLCDNLKSPKLDVITNKSLMYAIGRSVDKLEQVVKLMDVSKVVPNYEDYLEETRSLNERLSGGKTIEAVNGSRVWDINYNSNEYINEIKKIQEKYGIDEYDQWMKGEFEEDLTGFLHYVNQKEVSIEKDVPNFGVYKLIKILFKEE